VLTDAADAEQLLHRLNVLMDGVKEALDECVALARREGVSWGRIGDATNLTRQSAHERWRWVDSRRSNDAA
jgi:hypothetical protein